MPDRFQKLRHGIDKSATILEIGPSFSPITPKAEGWQSFVVDHTTKADLIEKYRSDPAVNASAIEDVDFIWQDGYLHESIPASRLGTFDACIASHVIEHVPDLIGFFKSLEKVLQPSGVVSLAVPDKRFCFDFFKPITTTGELLSAYDGKRTRHSKRTVFDFQAYGVRNGSQHAWGQLAAIEFAFWNRLADAKAAFDAHQDSSEAPYIDFHAWHFTPSSFELIILELGALDVIDFHVAERFPSEGCEFIAILRRGRSRFESEEALQARRLALLKGTLVDAQEQVASAPDNRAMTTDAAEGLNRRLDEQAALIRQLDGHAVLIQRLDEQAAYLRDIADVATLVRKMLRPLRAVWSFLLPIRRSIARLRGRP